MEETLLIKRDPDGGAHFAWTIGSPGYVELALPEGWRLATDDEIGNWCIVQLMRKPNARVAAMAYANGLFETKPEEAVALVNLICELDADAVMHCGRCAGARWIPIAENRASICCPLCNPEGNDLAWSEYGSGPLQAVPYSGDGD